VLTNARALLLVACLACVTASLLLLTMEQRLVAAAPWLLALAASVFAVLRFMRPDAESDMIRKAQIEGYLAALDQRADVVQFRERKAR
jgi:hypothetical protein